MMEQPETFWTRRPWRQLGWRRKKTSSWLKKAMTPSHPATTSSLIVELYCPWTLKNNFWDHFLNWCVPFSVHFSSAACRLGCGTTELCERITDEPNNHPVHQTVNETWPCSKHVKANLDERASQTVNCPKTLLPSPNIEEVERVVQWPKGWWLKSHSIPVCRCVLGQDT